MRRILRLAILATLMALMVGPNVAAEPISDAEWWQWCDEFFRYQRPGDEQFGGPEDPHDYLYRPEGTHACVRPAPGSPNYVDPRILYGDDFVEPEPTDNGDGSNGDNGDGTNGDNGDGSNGGGTNGDNGGGGSGGSGSSGGGGSGSSGGGSGRAERQPSGGGGGGGGTYTPPPLPPPDLQVDLTVEAEPVQVGQTVAYDVQITNNTDATMTGLRWRDVTSDRASTALDNLDAGESVTVSGTFGPVQTMHLPGIILTVIADSDQTDERPASRYVQLIPAPTPDAQATPTPDTPAVTTTEPSGPFSTPSVLSLRVNRVTYTAPDIHLGHNIADFTVILPDGELVACNFLAHYYATGGLTRWGHAISEVIEEIPGTLTQYYQKGAADCHPVYAKIWVTERRLSWDYIGGGKGGAPDLGTEPGLVSEQPGVLLWWGHRISNYAIDGTEVGFRDFFDALGGTKSFGFPKTDARPDNHPQAVLNLPNTDTAVIRQYFQAAVLEYHPDDELQPVKTALLGDLLRSLRYPRESYLAFAAFQTAPKRSVGETYRPERAVFP